MLTGNTSRSSRSSSQENCKAQPQGLDFGANYDIIKKVLNFGIHVMQGYTFLKPSSTIDVEAYINDKVLDAQEVCPVDAIEVDE